MTQQVKYIGASDEQVRFGNGSDPRPVLTVGKIYDLESRDMYPSHTKFKLVGVEGKFNSVWFEEVNGNGGKDKRIAELEDNLRKIRVMAKSAYEDLGVFDLYIGAGYLNIRRICDEALKE